MAGPVLVALDGSDKDPRALPVAVALAGLAQAAIHLVHVVAKPPARVAEQAELLGVGEPELMGQRATKSRLGECAARLAAETRDDVTWEVREAPDGVAKELTRYAGARDALVLVMATRAANPMGRALVGSVADRVARECPRPVALVPPGADYMAGARVQFTRVLVPLDGSALAERGLDFLLRLPGADRLEYALLEVVPPGTDPGPAKARLQTAAARVRARGIASAETGVLEAKDPTRAIVATIRDALAGIVVMSTRGRGGLERLVLGSVAEGVVRGSEVPVVLLTPASLVDA